VSGTRRGRGLELGAGVAIDEAAKRTGWERMKVVGPDPMGPDPKIRWAQAHAHAEYRTRRKHETETHAGVAPARGTRCEWIREGGRITQTTRMLDHDCKFGNVSTNERRCLICISFFFFLSYDHRSTKISSTV
jgi:hypothetical protein